MRAGDVTECGIPSIGKIPWGSHFCHFYSKRADLVDGLVPYFVAGLANHERCVWITAPPLPAEEAVRELEKKMPDLGRHLQSGQIKVRDYDDWYAPGNGGLKEDVLKRWLREEEDALRAGFEGLRVTGNASFVERAGWREFMAYEGAVNEAVRRRRVIALCSYDLRKSGAKDLFEVVRNHHFTLDRGTDSWEVIEGVPKRPAT